GKLDILHRHVVLQVDEGATASLRAVGRQLTERPEAGPGRARGEPAPSCQPRCGRTGVPAFAQTRGELIRPAGSAGGPLGLHGGARYEGIDRGIEVEPAARLREQVDRRRPSAGEADAIAW